MIINCPNCGKEISSTSKTCIHCGYKMKKEGSKRKLPFLIGALVLIVGIALFILMQGKSQTGDSIITKKFIEMLNQYDDVSGCFVLDDKTNVVSVGKNGKYGLLSTDGELIVPCEYDSIIYPLSDSAHVFCVKKNGKYGMLNNMGEMVLPCEYDTKFPLFVEAYNKDYVLIQKNGMVGIYSLKKCKVVIPCKHKKAYGNPYFGLVFKNGNLLFEQENDRYALLNGNGDMLSDYVYSDVYSNSEYEVCPLCKNGEWGFVNKDGQEISNSFGYGRIYNENKGNAVYTRDYTVYYDTYGNQLSESDLFKGIKTVFSVVGNKYGNSGGTCCQGNKFRGGYAIVEKFDFSADKNMYGLIDEQGNEVIRLSADGRLDADLLEEGYVVKSYNYLSDNKQMGIMNVKGNLVIPCEYQEIIYLGQGLFIVKKDEKYGLYRENKGLITEMIYNSISTDFGYIISDGLGGSPFIRKPLKTIANTENSLIAVESLSGGWGIVDCNGNKLTECLYEDVRYSPYSVILVKKDDKWGLVDLNGQEIVTCIYDEMDDFSCGLARVKKNNRYGFVDCRGNSTFPK